MATIKSFTDLEQSKELAKIISPESADMCYKCLGEDPYDVVLRPYSEWKEEYKGLLVDKEVDVIPCWSLTALLSVLPRIDIEKEICSDDTYDYRVKAYIGDGYIGDWFDSPIDACVTMIICLHEQKLL